MYSSSDLQFEAYMADLHEGEMLDFIQLISHTGIFKDLVIFCNAKQEGLPLKQPCISNTNKIVKSSD